MSKEFDSLQKTSLLPPWLDDEKMLGDYPFLVMGGTHGDEYEQVRYVRSRMGRGSMPDTMLPIIANRAASDLAVRYTGSEQLMAWYSGRFDWQTDEVLTNEEQTAAGITWLVRHLKSPHLVIDRHDNCNGNRYAFTGKRTTPAALAAAHIAQHSVVNVSGESTFHNAIPRSIGFEEAAPSEQKAWEAYCSTADAQLRIIASLGHTGLTEYYYDNRVGGGLQYFEVVTEVTLVNTRTLAPNRTVLDVLSDLESIEALPHYGADIALTPQVKAALRLPSGVQYYWSAPPYANRSLPINNRDVGIADDVSRRIAWGTIMRKIKPAQPQQETDFVVFEE